MPNEQGFLGAIGDDLPSLIPLVFALIIFFAVFTNTFNVFDSRNKQFKDALEVVRLSDLFLGSSYIAGQQNFQKLCQEAQGVVSLKWQAVLLPLDVRPLEHKQEGQGLFSGIDVQTVYPQSFAISNIEPVLASPEYADSAFNKPFRCTNTSEQPSYFNQGTIIRFYPVALEINLLEIPGVNRFLVKPMLLVIVAWN